MEQGEAESTEKAFDEKSYREQLYDAGLTDKEIGDEVGVTRQAIMAWRHKRNLEPNGRRGNPLSREEEERRMELYEQGLSDIEMSEEIGVSRQAIQVWRVDRGLPVKDRNKPEAIGKSERQYGRIEEATKRRTGEFMEELLAEIEEEGGDE